MFGAASLAVDCGFVSYAVGCGRVWHRRRLSTMAAYSCFMDVRIVIQEGRGFDSVITSGVGGVEVPFL